MSNLIRRSWIYLKNFLNKICYGNNTKKEIKYFDKPLDVTLGKQFNFQKETILEKKKKKTIKVTKRRYGRKKYSIFIKKILKQYHPGFKISLDGICVMNCLLNDLFDRIATNASKLSHISKRKTILIRDIESAVKLVLPKELSKNANFAGSNAIARYKNSVST